MNRRNFSPGHLFSLLLMLIGVYNGDVAHAQTAETCTLSGTVLHVVTREPMAGITLGVGSIRLLGDERSPMVVPYGDPPATFEAVSDADGSFHIAGIEPGSRLLLIRDETMAAVKGELPFALKPGTAITGITVLVAEGATLSGTVYDESYARGIAGVVVEAVSAGNRNKGWQRAYRIVTDDDGSFRLGGLPSSRYQVRSALDDGFQQRSLTFLREKPVPYYFPVQWQENYGPIEFTVAPGARVQGVVVDQNGRPVAGAEVREPWSDWNTPPVYTGPDGTFSLMGWEKPEMPNLRAQKGNFYSNPIVPGAVESTGLTVEEYGPIRLVLQPAARITGHIIDSAAKKPGRNEGLPVHISSDNVVYPREDSSVTDSDGTFNFSGLPPGTYTLKAFRGTTKNSTAHSDMLTLDYGDHAMVEFDLYQRINGSLSMTMTSSIHALDDSEIPHVDRVSEPAFTFPQQPKYCQDDFEGLLVELVDPHGYPIPNAQMGVTKVEKIQPYDSERFARSNGRAFGDYILTGDDLGIFCLDTTPGDIYDIEVRSEYPTHRQQIVAGPGPLTRLRVVVPRGGTVRGRVTMGGAPVAGADLTFQMGTSFHAQSVTTGQDGYYTYPRVALQSNAMQCMLNSGRHRTQLRPIVWGPDLGGDVSFDFPPANGSIEGQIIHPVDVSPHGLEVNMLLANGESFTKYARLCEESRFFIPNLPPGTAFVKARLAHGDPSPVMSVMVEAGKTTVSIFPVEHGVKLTGMVERQNVHAPVIIRAYLGSAESLRQGEGWAWPRNHRGIGGAIVTGAINSSFPPKPLAAGELPVPEDHFAMANIQPGRLTLLCEKTSEPDKGWLAAPTVVGYAEIDVGTEDIEGIVLNLTEP